MNAACRATHHELRRADVQVAVVPGERRILGYRVVNDARQPVHVTPELGPLDDLTGGGGSVLATPWSVSPAGAFDLVPGGSRELRLAVDAGGLLVGHVYRTELVLRGTRIEPVSLVVRVEALEPIVGRHDCSRLRAWVRGCCFGDDVTAIRAPGQEARACCGPAR